MAEQAAAIYGLSDGPADDSASFPRSHLPRLGTAVHDERRVLPPPASFIH